MTIRPHLPRAVLMLVFLLASSVVAILRPGGAGAAGRACGVLMLVVVALAATWLSRLRVDIGEEEMVIVGLREPTTIDSCCDVQLRELHPLPFMKSRRLRLTNTDEEFVDLPLGFFRSADRTLLRMEAERISKR